MARALHSPSGAAAYRRATDPGGSPHHPPASRSINGSGLGLPPWVLPSMPSPARPQCLSGASSNASGQRRPSSPETRTVMSIVAAMAGLPAAGLAAQTQAVQHHQQQQQQQGTRPGGRRRPTVMAADEGSAAADAHLAASSSGDEPRRSGGLPSRSSSSGGGSGCNVRSSISHALMGRRRALRGVSAPPQVLTGIPPPAPQGLPAAAEAASGQALGQEEEEEGPTGWDAAGRRTAQQAGDTAEQAAAPLSFCPLPADSIDIEAPWGLRPEASAVSVGSSAGLLACSSSGVYESEEGDDVLLGSPVGKGGWVGPVSCAPACAGGWPAPVPAALPATAAACSLLSLPAHACPGEAPHCAGCPAEPHSCVQS